MVIASPKKLKIILLCLVFLISVSARLWNLNKMGRTWDEGAYPLEGYKFIELIKNGDLNNSLWYSSPDHPPFARFMYGLAIYLDIAPENAPLEKKFSHTNFYYDFTFTRLVSVFFSSLTVIVVCLIGFRNFGLFVGFTSGLILSLLPIFVGLSQLATLESMLIFFFTATIYLFQRFLEKMSGSYTILTGVFLGLAVQTKYTNLMLYPLLFTLYYYWFIYVGQFKKKKFFSKKLLVIFVISLLTIFILWPMPWFHLQQFISYTYNFRFAQTSLPVPEVFFAKLMLVPKVYYIVHFLITTPLLLFLLFIYGLIVISSKVNNYSFVAFVRSKKYRNDLLNLRIKKKSFSVLIKHFFFLSSSNYNYLSEKKRKYIWILIILIIWFSFPFLQSFYNFRQHGIRYIIQIYAPFSLICAIGIEHVISTFSNTKKTKIISLILLTVYLILLLSKISPYYLDYFNILVGGPHGVYEKRLFQMGWWGQGLGEAGYYLNTNAPKGASIGLAVKPLSSVPNIPYRFVEEFKKGKKYDYVMVSYHMIVREGFDDSEIKLHYKPIYNVLVDQAPLVTIYKHI